LWWTPAGLPVGSHFMARRGDERTLYELAYELEAARPWAMRRPRISIS
jgi:amidase